MIDLTPLGLQTLLIVRAVLAASLKPGGSRDFQQISREERRQIAIVAARENNNSVIAHRYFICEKVQRKLFRRPRICHIFKKEKEGIIFSSKIPKNGEWCLGARANSRRRATGTPRLQKKKLTFKEKNN